MERILEGTVGYILGNLERLLKPRAEGQGSEHGINWGP